MTTLQFVHSPNAPEAIGAYSQAVYAKPYIFCSGQLPIDANTGCLVEGHIEEQTIQVLKNIKSILEINSLSVNSVIKTTVFMKDLNHFDRMNKVYAHFFGAHKPARSTIQVAKLPKNALIEIECIAFYN